MQAHCKVLRGPTGVEGQWIKTALEHFRQRLGVEWHKCWQPFPTRWPEPNRDLEFMEKVKAEKKLYRALHPHYIPHEMVDWEKRHEAWNSQSLCFNHHMLGRILENMAWGTCHTHITTCQTLWIRASETLFPGLEKAKRKSVPSLHGPWCLFPLSPSFPLCSFRDQLGESITLSIPLSQLSGSLVPM